MRFLFLLLLLLIFLPVFLSSKPTPSPLTPSPTTKSTQIPTPTITPTPTPKPLTFAQLNTLYGPCAKLPVLMYHHIQSADLAKSGNYASLNVTPSNFKSQLQYLKDQKYTVISISQLSQFFSQTSTLPPKPILLTFDDGYADFFQQAYPLLKEFSFPAVVFLPTGLLQNPGYLTWDQISQMSGSVYFANHTWSHYRMSKDIETDAKEIMTADNQLQEHQLNSLKIFAYPYGTSNKYAQKTLSDLNYSIAFTTRSGQILCAKQKYDLPRLRAPNLPSLSTLLP